MNTNDTFDMSGTQGVIPIRSSPSSPKSTTATQLVPTTWQNSEVEIVFQFHIVSQCFIREQQFATSLPRKTILVDLAKTFTYHMDPHAHSDPTQSVGKYRTYRTYSKPVKQLETDRLPIHPSSCCQARRQQARSFPSTGPVSRSTAVTS